MAYLAILGLGIAFTLFGLRRTVRRGRPLDQSYVAMLIWRSYGLAAAVAGVVFPIVWLVASHALLGGSVEANLPPGYDVNVLKAAMLVGASTFLNFTFFGYRDHVFGRPGDDGNS